MRVSLPIFFQKSSDVKVFHTKTEATTSLGSLECFFLMNFPMSSQEPFTALRSFGGPIETKGRLRYVDGCSASWV